MQSSSNVLSEMHDDGTKRVCDNGSEDKLPVDTVLLVGNSRVSRPPKEVNCKYKCIGMLDKVGIRID